MRTERGIRWGSALRLQARIERERLVEHARAFVGLAVLDEQRAQVVVRLRRLGLDGDGLAELRDGIRAITLRRVREPEVVGGLVEVRVHRDRRLVLGDRLVEVLVRLGDDAEVEQRELVLRVLGEDLVVDRSRLGVLARVLQADALRQQMRDSLTNSLRLLRTDYIDLLMLHSAPLELLEDGLALDMLQQFKQQGYARAIGASTYGSEAPRRAIELGLDGLQVAYNILDQRLADEIMPLAQAQGVGIIVRSVFLKGALTPRAADLPAHLAPLRQQSEAIEQYANGLTPPQSRVELALRFVLSQSLVTSVLVGVRTEEELAAALQTADAPTLSPNIMAHLATLRTHDPMMLDPSTWDLP